MIDTDGLLLDPQYEGLGVTAVLAISADVSVELQVLDMTAGVDVTMGSGIEAPTLRPVALVRLAELEERGVATSALTGATLTFGGKAWAVANWRRKPVAGGQGEIMLILNDEDV